MNENNMIIKNNNFDAVRIGLALIVVFQHLAVLTGINEFQYFRTYFNPDFAVKGFFAISGYLVTKSYLTSSSLLEYFEKRIRRIYPAYLASICLCLLIGISVSKLGVIDFLTSFHTWKYFFSNAIFLNFIQQDLPLVFTDNLMNAMNGSLWTIKIELMLYFCIPPAVYLFHRYGVVAMATLMMISSILWVNYFEFVFEGKIGSELARQFPGQLSYFIFGSLLAINDNFLKKCGWLALFSLPFVFLIQDPQIRIFIDPLAYSSIVLFLATSAVKSLNVGRYGDVSYGIYLYHFPIIQLLVELKIFETNIWLGLVLTFLITIAISFFSWHAIEKKLLKRNSHYIINSKK
jgi:peptidoglycan/LPS O-acetylase OafA/YrhL